MCLWWYDGITRYGWYAGYGWYDEVDLLARLLAVTLIDVGRA